MANKIAELMRNFDKEAKDKRKGRTSPDDDVRLRKYLLGKKWMYVTMKD